MAETRMPNPYRPGFNQPPVVFAGRTDVLDGTREALQVAAYDGRTPRPVVLVGPRGVGKTVTLG
ncbi:MAG: ATP-binding protein, partial [Actinomycetota bacterium]|nr:ATP-binding protein [Actinomycetota bacterium]